MHTCRTLENEGRLLSFCGGIVFAEGHFVVVVVVVMGVRKRQ